MSKKLIFFLAHIDDFEISCLGYLFKYFKEYDKIQIIIASTWSKKESIWKSNLEKIKKYLNKDIDYINLNFNQRRLTSDFDDVKDKFYNIITFNSNIRFDIVTHDAEDCHTDHTAVYKIAKGLFKYTDRFLSIYSPSSSSFNPNFWVGISDLELDFKKKLVVNYNIENEQSYSSVGNYLQDNGIENFLNNSYFFENFIYLDFNYYECYKLLKWR